MDKALVGEENVLVNVPPKPAPLSKVMHVPSLATAVPVLWDDGDKGRISTIYNHGVDECILLDLFPDPSQISSITSENKLDNLY